MATINFSNIINGLENPNETISVVESNRIFRNGETLYLQNYVRDKYLLYIMCDGQLGGPFENKSVIRSNTGFFEKIKDKIAGNPSNSTLYIVNLQPCSLIENDFVEHKTAMFVIENKITMSLTFKGDVSMSYRIKPEGIDNILGMCFNKEIDTVSRYVYNNVKEIINTELMMYINCFLGNPSDIGSSKDMLDLIGKIEAMNNVDQLNKNLIDRLRNNNVFTNFIIDKFEIIVTCVEKNQVLENSNKIGQINQNSEVKKAQIIADNQEALIDKQGKLDVEQAEFDQKQANKIREAETEEIQRLKQLSVDAKERMINEVLDIVKMSYEESNKKTTMAYEALNNLISSNGGMGVDFMTALNYINESMESQKSAISNITLQMKDMLALTDYKSDQIEKIDVKKNLLTEKE